MPTEIVMSNKFRAEKISFSETVRVYVMPKSPIDKRRTPQLSKDFLMLNLDSSNNFMLKKIAIRPIGMLIKKLTSTAPVKHLAMRNIRPETAQERFQSRW
jgi:hypothetical protein